jgi:hypothetical protein
MGACFDALLSVAPERALEILAAYVEDENEELAFEAASALGASRLPGAFDLLVGKIEGGHLRAEAFLRCLTPKKSFPEMRARIDSAVESHGSAALRRLFQTEFPALD